MAVRPCLRWPHPCLKTPAATVEAITPEIRTIWADMVDTMEAMPGYGLAAVQIGVPLLGKVPLEAAVAAGGDAGAPVALDGTGAAAKPLRGSSGYTPYDWCGLRWAQNGGEMVWVNTGAEAVETALARPLHGSEKQRLRGVFAKSVSVCSHADAQRTRTTCDQRVGAVNIVWRCDKTLMSQLIHNLYVNAVNYNLPNGWIHISLKRVEGGFELTVENPTQDAPSDLAERAFDRFYRGDASHTRRVDGLGLGLSICQEIAKLHHSTLSIWVTERYTVLAKLSAPFQRQ